MKWIGKQTGEVQTATIQSVDVRTETIFDPGGRITLWEDLISLTPGDAKARKGDSGAALIAKKDMKIVGLLCKGSETKSHYFASRIPPENYKPSWRPTWWLGGKVASRRCAFGELG